MENQVANETEQSVDYKAEFEKIRQDYDKVKAHNEQLFAEAKKAKEERQIQAEAAEKAMKEKAIKDGEYEKLWKSTQEEAKSWEQKYNELYTQQKQEKIQSHAMKIAVELADGDASSAKLLSKFLQETLSKVVDEKGGLEDGVLEAVKKEYKNNKDFAPLLSGSRATGGGAPGQSNGVRKGVQSLTRAEFAQLNPVKQHEFVARIRQGSAQLVDNQ